MNILFLSMSPMRRDNTIGNTYENIFEGINNMNFASIYCRSGMPNVNFIKKYFQITDKEIIKNLLNKNRKVGREINQTDEIVIDGSADIRCSGRLINMIRIFQFRSVFFVRDFIWKVGRWKSNELQRFIKDFNPDIIFAPLINDRTLNRFIEYVHKVAGCKLVVYAWDDVYTLNQFSFSPMFWFDRLYQRKGIRAVAKESDRIYVISQQQKEVYDKCFKKDCKILFKGHVFKKEPNIITKEPISLIFTGNLGYKRWKTIIEIGKALKKINEKSVKAQLFVYSKTALKKSTINEINIPGSVYFMGAVSHREAMNLQEKADILLHIESFSRKQRDLVRLSFSTKLVDYFNKAKCIFAVGPKDVASIDYLLKNDAAVVVTNSDQIEKKLVQLIEKPDLIKAYGHKSWECGKRNHRIEKIQDDLYKDLSEILR